MRKASNRFALLVVSLAFATPALAQTSITGTCPPNTSGGQCLWTECTQTGNGVQCAKYAPLTATAPVIPPAVFAPSVATMAPARAPGQQVAPTVPHCAGNVCVDPEAGKFCGLHWCIWLLGGAILFGLGVLYLIMSRIRLATALGDYRAHVAHWNLLVDVDGKPLPGVSTAVAIEVAKALEAAWAEVNAIDWMRFLRIQDNGQTLRPGHAAPRGLPTTAAGTTP